ncbi:MAG: PAS domain S-box protein [Tunicatimonas sp.]
MSSHPSGHPPQEALIREVERLRHELAISQAREEQITLGNLRLEELYQDAHDLVQVCNRRGQVLFANQAWCQLLGYQPAQEDLYFLDLVHPQYRKVAVDQLNRVKQPGGGARFRTVLVARSGALVHVSGNIAAYVNERGDQIYRGIFQDITEQVRDEQARHLYNNIANHTLRSPNLNDLYHNIYRELKKEVSAEDIVITRWEAGRTRFSYWDGPLRPPASGDQREGYEDLVSYAVGINKPLLLSASDLHELIARGTIRPLPVVPQTWIGIPLNSAQRTIGVLFVQHRKAGFLSTRDLKLLDFVSGQLALAVTRKSDEEKLAEQQSRQYAIFESSTHLVWSVNKRLELTAFNRNFEKTMRAQYAANPQMGAQYHPDHAEATRHYLDNWQEKYQEAFRGKLVQFETCLSNNAQAELWKMVFINPIYRPDGTIHEVSGIAHDITQRKKSEQALLTSEAKFRNIFESFQDIYFRCRPDGTITLISPSVKDLSGYQTYEVLGKNVTNYYLYDKRTKNLIRKLVNQKSVRNFEATVIDSAGDLVQCICNVRLVDSLNGRDREIEGVVRDITDLKKATLALQKAKDEAERALKVKEAFLANMSHEIRTPMNGLMNMVDLLAGTSLTVQQQDYLQTVQNSSETLLTIVNDILDLSKIEAGKMTLQPKPTKVSATFDHLLNLFSRQATEKDVSLSQRIDASVPPVLRVDETRLLQVLSNLVSNALKFTEASGSVRVEVTRAAAEPTDSLPDEHLIRVVVRDSGIGISEKDQKTLFEKFSQVDASATKRYAGTGLGLSISRQLVQLMGGDIGVDSSSGQGSAFWFTFRAVGTDDVLPESSPKKLTFTQPGPRVLVVDDNHINRRVAYEILRNAHCSVDTAESGEAAISLVEQQSYDVVLMDIQMPGMSGIEAAQQIKALPLKKQPPVVAMTAYSLPGDQERFVAAGLDDYLSKPIRPEAMLPKVASLSGFTLEQSTSVPTDASAAPPSVIDQTVLNKLAKYGGEELVVASLRDFDEETQELLQEAEAACQQADYEVVQRSLHTLKGNASTLGVQRLAERAAHAEAQLKQKKYGELSEDLLHLRTLFAEFQRTFRASYNLQSHV